jgi:virginiamycin B lyase
MLFLFCDVLSERAAFASVCDMNLRDGTVIRQTPYYPTRLAQPMHAIQALLARSLWLLAIATFVLCGAGSGLAQNSQPARPGVTTPGVRRSMTDIHPEATFAVEGEPDWMVVTDDAVWVTSSNVNHVVRLDATTNRQSLLVTIDKPCSGLAAGFGSIWVPSCGAHALLRVDPQTGKIQAEIPAGPADSEGGITVGAGSVWMATDKKGVLARVDPQTNKVVGKIAIPSGSYAPAFAEGAVWITSTEHNLLTRVDAQSNRVLVSIPIGPQPRFLTVGAGSVWTLNQGDGTISRVDTKTNKLVATIAVGIPGTGGEIAFGQGAVWATVFQIPMSRIDPATNTVVQQWTGAGGDSIRLGHGSIWLSDFAHSAVWRLNARQP